MKQWEKAETYFRKVDVLEETDENVDREERIETFEKLLLVLTALEKKDEVAVVKARLSELENLGTTE